MTTQLIAVWVVDTGMVAQHRQTGSASTRGIGLLLRQASHGVGDDHGDGTARAARRARLRTGVRIDQQR